MINVPFARDVWHSLAEFSNFEKNLLNARRLDERLNADLRLNRESWMN